MNNLPFTFSPERIFILTLLAMEDMRRVRPMIVIIVSPAEDDEQ